MDRPYYTLQFDVAACCYVARVNDIPVLEEYEGGQCTVEIPLNQWIHSGNNELQVDLSPVADADSLSKEANFAAEVYVRESGSTRESRILVGEFAYPSETDGLSVDASDAGVRVRWPLELDVPFEWTWQTAPLLTRRSDLHEEAVGQLKRIWNACQEKDLDTLKVLFRERNRELARAYFKSFDEREQEFEKQYERLFSGDKNLGFFRETGIAAKVFGQGRMVRLDAEWNDSPLFYIDAEWTMATYLPVIFMRSADGDLIPIR